MSIAEQIGMAMRQLTEEGDHNLSEAIYYEPENGATISGKRAVFRRGEATVVPVMGAEYDVFEADITIYTADLGSVIPRSGDQVRLADLTELWRVLGIRAQIPGAYIVRAVRKVLRPAVAEE